MERLGCDNAAKVLAGAVYACLVSGGDFDRGLIVAVNHSGRSAAVGAIVGAILGIRLGEQALPEFYIECLEPAEILRELADDLFTGCPMEMGNKLFDLDGDYKYLHGGQETKAWLLQHLQQPLFIRSGSLRIERKRGSVLRMRKLFPESTRVFRRPVRSGPRSFLCRRPGDLPAGSPGRRRSPPDRCR